MWPLCVARAPDVEHRAGEVLRDLFVVAVGLAGVLAAGADGRDVSHVAGHAGVDVEVQEQRLAAAGEGALGAGEDQVLGLLPHLSSVMPSR